MKLRLKKKPSIEMLERRELLSADISLPAASVAPATASPVWSSYAGGAQHQALSSIASQTLSAIHWQTPVDLDPQYDPNSGDLLIHYGSPLVTAANTIIVPVKTGATGGFEIEALNGANGNLIWTQTSDYILPAHDWTPSYSPVLVGDRIYYPGAGGTVYYRDSLDTASATGSGQLAFYGVANYTANQSTYNSSIQIDTPITADAAGDIDFGFTANGSNPLGITDGYARIDPSGNATYVTVSSATAGVLSHALTNAAPALSLDGTHLYVVASNVLGVGVGELLELDSTTLATQASVILKDPSSGQNALLDDDGTASPMVGPDGDVYFGVLENPFPANHDRGWMLHFSGDLSQEKTPGAFGWDDTASVVPASMVPSYHGTSTYLLMTKYNNYADPGLGGDGVNKIAILDPNDMNDPNDTETDPVTGATVMKEVLTIAGLTPDTDFTATDPNAVREWCINTAVVDPATDSVLAGSEDGKLYRWNLTTNSFSQIITLTPGIGEAYTPTLIGADGTVYAINNATLFAVGNPSADLSVVVTDNAGGSPSGGTTTGGVASVNNPVVYTIVVTNTSSTIAVNGASVVDSLPSNFFAAGSVSYTATQTGGASGFTGGSGSISGNITDNAINLPALASVTYSMTGTVASSATNFIIDSATVNVPSGYSDPNSNNNSSTDTIALPAGVRVSVLGPSTDIPGSNVQFNIIVTNDGTAGVTGVGIGNSIPAADFSTVLFNTTSTGGATGFTASSGTVIGTPGTASINDTVNLPAGSTITYVIVGTIADSTTGTMTDLATATTPNGVPNLDHDAGKTNTNSASVPVSLSPKADVYVAIEGSDPLSTGVKDIYTLVVSNNGPSATPGVVLHDAFSSLSNITYTSAVLYGTASGNSQGAAPVSSLTLNDTLTLSGNAIVQYTVTGTVSSGAPATLTDTVSATVPGGIDPVLANNTASVSATVAASATGSVAGRYAFYFNSAFDGGNITPLTVPTTADFSAIAPDKVALMPGQTANFNNYTNYTNGLDAIFIDLFGDKPGSIAATDFEFAVGNKQTVGTGTNPGAGWVKLATVPTVTAFAGQGVGGSDRIALTWPAGTIAGQWLQITVKGDSNTGLVAADPDVFYFGNAIGDSGNSTTDSIVNGNDEIAARNDPHGFSTHASISDPHDYNRDKLVNGSDEIAARLNGTGFSSQLILLSAPTLPNQAITTGQAQTFSVKSSAPSLLSAAGNNVPQPTLANPVALPIMLSTIVPVAASKPPMITAARKFGPKTSTVILPQVWALTPNILTQEITDKIGWIASDLLS